MSMSGGDHVRDPETGGWVSVRSDARRRQERHVRMAGAGVEEGDD